jgi:hypothetical protein
MKKIAILQSNYIPWKGYFDLIAAVDEFILYDDMQYTRRDWRNRNKIKTPQGMQWLTIPVKVKGKYLQTIRETEISDQLWATTHWKIIEQNYHRAPYFEDIACWLRPIYLKNQHISLSPLNRTLIEAICNYLGIMTKISNSWDYILAEGKTERLTALCLQTGASEYFSGPSAKGYIEPAIFTQQDIKLRWFEYENYQEYPQLWGKFTHAVTILDLLFNCGKYARQFMRYVK